MLRLVALGRIYTCDRLAKWGMDINLQCQLCNTQPESIQHLFFGCNYTGQLWARLLKWMHIQRPCMEWEGGLKWVEKWCKGKSSRAEVYKITLTAAVYFIWKESNQRVFQQKRRSIEDILKHIAQEVYFRAI
ncbi:hypothetical protein MTR67_051326 [Solanum verrucosum]|uniref:Reverse transcriptase zinc-binding domain-containing protein n=1 Tax=Solanum verrucosum TaxID=315347 RepID=A0AAF0V771_SOLVR|nr:hypothetical protein MTR67_051326 [Solanum verrucosum]